MSIEVMNRVWKKSDQKGSGLLLLLAIADYSNDRGFCFPGIKALAGRIRMSERQTQRILLALEEQSEIYCVKDKGRGRKTFYIVTTALKDEDVESVLIEDFRVAPLEAKMAVRDWRAKGNVSVFVDVKDDNLSPFNEEKSETDLSKEDDNGDRNADISISESDTQGQKGDISSVKGDISRGPYKEHEPMNRHEPPLEPPVEPSVDPSCARARAGTETGPSSNGKIFWTLSDDDPGKFQRKKVVEAFERLTGHPASQRDRELVELLGGELPFSSAAVITLMEKISARAGETQIRSFAYFRTAIAEIGKRCTDAVISACRMTVVGAPEMERIKIILRAVRREVAEWDSRAP